MDNYKDINGSGFGNLFSGLIIGTLLNPNFKDNLERIKNMTPEELKIESQRVEKSLKGTAQTWRLKEDYNAHYRKGFIFKQDEDNRKLWICEHYNEPFPEDNIFGNSRLFEDVTEYPKDANGIDGLWKMFQEKYK